jgi:hypothetical protein
MLFFVKVRINVDKLEELGHKLSSGELDITPIQSTYCVQDDPTVGLNIWEAEDQADFEARFEPHKAYYADVMEITPVMTPEESQKMLMEQSNMM